MNDPYRIEILKRRSWRGTHRARLVYLGVEGMPQRVCTVHAETPEDAEKFARAEAVCEHEKYGHADGELSIEVVHA